MQSHKKLSKIFSFAGVSILSLISLGQSGDFKYRKQVISTQYFSEGADRGDFNKDGKWDFVSGPFWYEGPDFTIKHEYNTSKILDAAGGEYTSNFFAWAVDVDGDGWTDIVIAGLPGEAGYWYKNPGSGSVNSTTTHWQQYPTVPEVGNESPEMIDINGDGKRDLLFNTNAGVFTWAEPNLMHPDSGWKTHAISTTVAPGRYTHGLGFGDINGDGRMDIIWKNGWFEQPATLVGDPLWTLHSFTFAPEAAQMFVYDVDGDGDNDVITCLEAHRFGLAWWEQTKNGTEITFKEHKIMGDHSEENIYGQAFSQLHALALTDIDGDGLKDLITGKRKWGHGPSGDVEPNAPMVLYAFQLTRNQGQVKYIPHPIDSASGIGTELVVKDMDGNGLDDILIGNKNGAYIFFKEGAAISIRPQRQLTSSVDGGQGVPSRLFHYDIRGLLRQKPTSTPRFSLPDSKFTLARP